MSFIPHQSQRIDRDSSPTDWNQIPLMLIHPERLDLAILLALCYRNNCTLRQANEYLELFPPDHFVLAVEPPSHYLPRILWASWLMAEFVHLESLMTIEDMPEFQ